MAINMADRILKSVEVDLICMVILLVSRHRIVWSRTVVNFLDIHEHYYKDNRVLQPVRLLKKCKTVMSYQSFCTSHLTKYLKIINQLTLYMKYCSLSMVLVINVFSAVFLRQKTIISEFWNLSKFRLHCSLPWKHCRGDIIKISSYV